YRLREGNLANRVIGPVRLASLVRIRLGAARFACRSRAAGERQLRADHSRPAAARGSLLPRARPANYPALRRLGAGGARGGQRYLASERGRVGRGPILSTDVHA